MQYQRLASVGEIAPLGGGSLCFHGDGTLTTGSGHLPTVIPVGVSLSSSSFYYEITVVTGGRATVGWVNPSLYTGNSASAKGVGCDEHSWGFDGREAVLRHNGRKISNGANGADGGGGDADKESDAAWGYVS